MCGRYSVRNPEQIAERFGIDAAEVAVPDFHETRITPRFNVAPSDLVPGVLLARDGEARHVRPLRWGFQPAWMKPSASTKRPPLINARAETLAESGLFRSALARGRCIIPADGFYEWRTGATARSPKQPIYFRRIDGDMFGFAGLWATNPEGELSFAIVTVQPNKLVTAYHDRMPAILLAEHEALWLDPAEADASLAASLLRPYPEDWMQAYPVSPLVNNVKNDGPELIEPHAE